MRMDRIRFYLTLGLPAFVLASPAQAAPSFDCAKATTAVERLICANGDLADRDTQLAAAMKDALGRAGNSREELLKQQRAWIETRDSDCAGELDNKPDTEARLQSSACLEKAYANRVKDLRIFKSPIAQASLPLCRAIADRFEALLDRDPEARYRPPPGENHSDPWYGISVLDMLAADKQSGLVLGKEFIESASAESFLEEISKALRPVTLSDSLRVEISEKLEGQWNSLARAPGTNAYVATSVGGTAHCLNDTWFEVHGTHARIAAESGNSQGACSTTRQFATLDSVPVEIFPTGAFTPGLNEKLSISAFVDAVWAPSCTVNFDFAVRFDRRKSRDTHGDVCTGPDCETFARQAADLAEAFQNDSSAFSLELKSWSAVSANEFRDVYRLWRKQRTAQAGSPSGSENESSEIEKLKPDEALDAEPQAMPLQFSGKIYLVTLGHQTTGWRVNSPWDVEFWRIEKGDLLNESSFTIEVSRGKLLRVGVSHEAR